jgi:hypothetical protein
MNLMSMLMTFSRLQFCAVIIWSLLQTVFITSSGSWKLGGFGFALSVDQATGGLASSQQFHYSVGAYDIVLLC